MTDLVSASIVKPVVDAFLALRRLWKGRRGQLKPEEIVQLRLTWKPIFDEWLMQMRRKNIGRDVTVKDVRRLDEYPEVNEDIQGISPWFRAGLVATNDRGLLLLLDWVSLSDEALDFLQLQGIREDNAKETGNAALVGYVPFEQVVQFDKNGDDYSTRPSLYLHFDAKREGPYERIALCIRKEMKDCGAEWYSEICEIDEYRDACLKLGIELYWLKPPNEWGVWRVNRSAK
ncbi:MAG: hypothetical protein KDJ47_13180 [Hyphomicrobiaceae bacterium]|nr:hypothetical protein [Hyphomicrobiaceae bacterium]